jgi:hypothetical protein
VNFVPSPPFDSRARDASSDLLIEKTGRMTKVIVNVKVEG